MQAMGSRIDSGKRGKRHTPRVARRAQAVLAAASLIVGLGWSAAARADGTTSPTDVVRLKDGSFFRGTILELVPNDHVDLLLPSGEKRRFPMTDVATAEPGAGATPATAPPSPPAPAAPTAGADTVRVHFEAADPDMRLLRTVRYGELAGAPRGYQVVCTTPCDASLPRGATDLALATASGRPVETEKPIVVEGVSTLRGSIASHRSTRIAGAVTLGATLLAGAGIFTWGLAEEEDDCDQANGSNGCSRHVARNWGIVAAGGAILAVGLAVGIPLIALRDRAHIEVVPLAQSTPMRSGWMTREHAAAVVDGQGLALRMRW